MHKIYSASNNTDEMPAQTFDVVFTGRLQLMSNNPLERFAEARDCHRNVDLV